ncbi:MAG: MBL fold metallo-hydrolase [Algoriphagus sp.]|uniref:MBL fold metallo-hydrolase n=1 Tax=Algoriphagus sp. TaxID=1872435 RepID=UPI00271841B8|nr:MBL fold metallo-hydrolase [Algoriphagus sp.]MDO8968764.1 MBL fold metallo-hydrolase [Algoriphagus sp.]MDP2040160.1 MBL fold metallo-hydrolase [Algoriphagus sp.]MDP3199318.1 MBL fold metallo-hydrolase [Algoriphagus sp.]MDP3474172.1 MBL fold metallo-hydrolase [Algoriphagus sp.]
MLYIKSFTFNPFQENTYLAYDDLGSAVLIDPGCHTVGERKELEDFIISKELKVLHLLNTHCHIDHVLGNAWAKKRFGIPLWIHEKEIPVLKSVEVYAPNYGFQGYESSEADYFLTEGQEFKVGEELLKVLFVPGHAPGHVVFYHEKSKQCIAGDTLFRGSIGRTDLPGGNHALLLEKIKTQLFTLPAETVIYCGHGPETKIAFEKIYNPFVGERAIQ